MRKRGARRSPPPVKLTPKQVADLTMPIHIAMQMLPLGLYTEDHAHDLVAFLGVAHFAATETNKQDARQVCSEASEILLTMAERAKRTGSWNVTSAECKTLLGAVTAIDEWMHHQNADVWMRALRRMMKACDEAGGVAIQ